MPKWIVGESGNPRKKRCRSTRLDELVREIGQELITFEDCEPPGGPESEPGAAADVQKMTRRERLVRIVWTAALEGNLQAAKWVAAHLDGNPVHSLAVTVEARFTPDEYAQAELELAEWKASRMQVVDESQKPDAAEGGQA